MAIHEAYGSSWARNWIWAATAADSGSLTLCATAGTPGLCFTWDYVLVSVAWLYNNFSSFVSYCRLLENQCQNDTGVHGMHGVLLGCILCVCHCLCLSLYICVYTHTDTHVYNSVIFFCKLLSPNQQGRWTMNFLFKNGNEFFWQIDLNSHCVTFIISRTIWLSHH